MQNHTLYNDYYEEYDFDFSGAAIPEANNSAMRNLFERVKLFGYCVR